MKGAHRFLEIIQAEKELTRKSIAGESIIEVAENRRMLIEKHCGIIQYSQELIGIKMPFGCVVVSGTSLEMSEMTKDRLLITGTIDSISLQRRK